MQTGDKERTAAAIANQLPLSECYAVLRSSQKTMSVVRENVIAAILIKGSFAVLAFPGIITL